MLTAIVAHTADQLYALMIDRFGSHVVRKLLCTLAGWDVVPGRAKAAASAPQASAVQLSSMLKLCMQDRLGRAARQ